MRKRGCVESAKVWRPESGSVPDVGGSGARDVTASGAASQQLMHLHQLIGPPTVMLFDAQGRE